MKKVKIANGIKRIEETDTNATLFRLRDILSEHRAILISRILSDLPSYIDYKFKLKATGRDLEAIRETLFGLKNSVLDLDKYNEIIEHFLGNDMTYIKSEPFLKEIDETISAGLNYSQLKLV